MAHSFLPNGLLTEMLALLTAALRCEDAEWQQGFSFKRKVTSAFHASHFSCGPELRGTSAPPASVGVMLCSSVCILLSSWMPSMLSKLKTWRGKAARAPGHLQGARRGCVLRRRKGWHERASGVSAIHHGGRTASHRLPGL